MAKVDLNEGTKTSQTTKAPLHNTKLIQAHVPASVHKAMKRYCAENDITVKDLIIMSFNHYTKET